MGGAGAVEQQPHPSPGGLGGLRLPMISAPSSLPAWQAHGQVSVPRAEVTRGVQPAWAAASLLPVLHPSLQAAPFLPCGTLLDTSAQTPASSLPQPRAQAVAHTLDTCSGCRGATAVGSKGLAMSVGANEPKSPSLAAGAPQGPLRGGQALREEGEDGS